MVIFGLFFIRSLTFSWDLAKFRPHAQGKTTVLLAPSVPSAPNSRGQCQGHQETYVYYTSPGIEVPLFPTAHLVILVKQTVLMNGLHLMFAEGRDSVPNSKSRFQQAGVALVPSAMCQQQVLTASDHTDTAATLRKWSVATQSGLEFAICVFANRGQRIPPCSYPIQHGRA